MTAADPSGQPFSVNCGNDEKPVEPKWPPSAARPRGAFSKLVLSFKNLHPFRLCRQYPCRRLHTPLESRRARCS